MSVINTKYVDVILVAMAFFGGSEHISFPIKRVGLFPSNSNLICESPFSVLF